jgi:hypothetical protein
VAYAYIAYFRREGSQIVMKSFSGTHKRRSAATARVEPNPPRIKRMPRELAGEPGGGEPGGGEPFQFVVDDRKDAAIGSVVAHFFPASSVGAGAGFAASSFARSAFHASNSAFVPAASPAAIRRSSASASRGRSTSGIAADDRAIPS